MQGTRCIKKWQAPYPSDCSVVILDTGYWILYPPLWIEPLCYTANVRKIIRRSFTLSWSTRTYLYVRSYAQSFWSALFAAGREFFTSENAAVSRAPSSTAVPMWISTRTLTVRIRASSRRAGSVCSSPPEWRSTTLKRLQKTDWWGRRYKAAVRCTKN